jgi:hypothetical protein
MNVNHSISLCLAGLLVTIRVLAAEPTSDKTDEPTGNEWSSQMTAEAERELGNWTNDCSDLTPLIADVLNPSADIIGSWEALSEGGSRLVVRIATNGQRVVRFSTRGSFYDRSFDRTATYSSGVLTFNRPVKQNPVWTYNALYLCRVDGTDFLVSKALLRFFAKEFPTNGLIDWRKAKDILITDGFHRKAKDETQPEP